MSTQDNLKLQRIVNAPKEQVFEAWSKPELLRQWWSPTGYSTPVYESDFRVGGKLHYCMESPEGVRSWGGGYYTEIDVPNRIVMDDSFMDEQGNMVPAATGGHPEGWPDVVPISVTLSDMGNGKTRMDIEHFVAADLAREVQCDVGWNQLLDKLETLLANLADAER